MRGVLMLFVILPKDFVAPWIFSRSFRGGRQQAPAECKKAGQEDEVGNVFFHKGTFFHGRENGSGLSGLKDVTGAADEADAAGGL